MGCVGSIGYTPAWTFTGVPGCMGYTPPWTDTGVVRLFDCRFEWHTPHTMHTATTTITTTTTMGMQTTKTATTIPMMNGAEITFTVTDPAGKIKVH